ncbi:winged helix-turn-helix transcriptional regulator [Clostridium sp. YIM B02505]|uniref:Winged helix-turn-helix transcriptional regulator n=1 Tax=Clostridium yunnanense TaxID=2800325 RepID=A0ABS1EU10_9CLOT|nr:MarR family winged helix-turn-helix transcriptional regulator [Clostridium yunnanense]MBK1812788.1 winged helix-turn-helix transcriptional regulator [Clostridium yunnanense]
MEELYFLNYFGAIYRKSQLYIKAALADRNMSFSEAMVLIYVSANPGTIQDDIGTNLSIDKSVVTRSIKNLVALGLLTRTEDSTNQRVKKVYATEAAKEFRIYWNKLIKQWNETLLADLTPEERSIVVSASYKIKTSAITADIQEEVKKIK